MRQSVRWLLVSAKLRVAARCRSPQRAAHTSTVPLLEGSAPNITSKWRSQPGHWAQECRLTRAMLSMKLAFWRMDPMRCAIFMMTSCGCPCSIRS